MAIKSLAFCLDDLSAGQTAYTLIKGINEYLEKSAETNITLFYSDPLLPCLAPKTSRHALSDSKGFVGVLVATSIKTAQAIVGSNRAKKYWYITDLSFDKEIAKNLLSDGKILPILRSKDYTEVIPGKIIEDYSIEQFLELTNG